MREGPFYRAFSGMSRAVSRWLNPRYVRLLVDELWRWRRGRQHRTRERVMEEYGRRQMDLAQPIVLIDPNGRLYPSTAREARTRNWARIVEAFAMIGVRRGRVLEIGAGDGINLRGLRSLAFPIEWHGCDLVPRDRSIVAADATSLPFATLAFDAILTYNAIEQMPGEVARRVFLEMMRVSRRGVVSVEPDFQRAAWPQRLSMIRKDYVRDIVGPATMAGFKLVGREWTFGGNALNRPAIFVFGKDG